MTMADHQGNQKYRSPSKISQKSKNCYFEDRWGLFLVAVSLLMKAPMSAKKALKLKLIDEKIIDSIVLTDFQEQTKQNQRVCEFFRFGHFEQRRENPENL